MAVVRLYDTTLREGTQSPVARITPDVKIEVIRILDELGVDAVEAGFPRADPRDVEVMRKARELVSRVELSGFARSVEKDIQLVKEAGADIVQVFIPGSDSQLAAIMGVSWSDAMSRLEHAIEYGNGLGLRVYVAVTDAVRAREEVLRRIAGIASRKGAEEVVLADTIGVGVPDEIAGIVSTVLDEGFERVGLHLHNDLGLATCNALAGIKAGAMEIQVTIGGIGERLGNTPLEELAAIAKVKGLFETNIEYGKLIPLVRRALEVMGVKPYPLKPIIGDYAYLHVSDIHVYSTFRYPGSFEAFDPSIFGGQRVVRFGTLTGAKSVKYALSSRGIEVSDEEARELAKLVRRRARGVDDYSVDDLVKFLEELRAG